MGIVNMDKTLGQMRSQETFEHIVYKPFEFANHSLGILSPDVLNVGIHVVLETHRCQELLFIVMKKEADPNRRLFRYRIFTNSEEIDLSQALEIDPISGRFKLDRVGNCLQNTRLAPIDGLSVDLKTFGPAYPFRLSTIDLSKTRMMLCAVRPCGTIPFNDRTMLEICINLPNTKTLHPLYKVMRCFSEGKYTRQIKYYALQFVDFDDTEMVTWFKYLEEIELSRMRCAQKNVAA